MRTHQRFIATAMAVGAALLSPAPVCADGVVQAAASDAVTAPSLLETHDFGGAAVPEDTASIVAKRPTAGADADVEEVSGGRRLMWWNWIAAHVHGCPPGPAGHLCHKGGGSSSGGSYSGKSGGGGGGGGGGSNYSGNGGGGNSQSGGGGNNVHSSVSGNNGGGGNSAHNSSSRFIGSSPSSIIGMVVAAVAAGTAIAAAVIGSRRRDTSTAHPLQGSVKNRMRLFGNFADRNLVSKTERPCGRVVEMSSPPVMEDAHYNEMA